MYRNDCFIITYMLMATLYTQLMRKIEKTWHTYLAIVSMPTRVFTK